MNWKTYITICSVLLMTACQELPNYLAGDTTLARAGRKVLRLRDVESVVPRGVTGDDSVALLEVYVDRWVRKQLKLQEAEVLFSSSEEDIARMVEEYRQALLIRKLEQHYVDTGIDTTFTAQEFAVITMLTRPISGSTCPWSRGASCVSTRTTARRAASRS